MTHLNRYIKFKNGGLDLTLDDIGTDEFPQLLYEFYTDAQYKSIDDGVEEKFKNSTMNSIRAGINRHLKDTRSVDIIKDMRFTKSNQMLKTVKKTNKSQGKGNVDHKLPITEADRQKLNQYFKEYMRPSSKILQQFYSNIMLFGCRRGHENLSTMTKDTFEVCKINFKKVSRQSVRATCAKY